MKTKFLLLLAFFTQFLSAQVWTDPNPAIAEGQVIVYFDKAGTGLDSYNGTIYAHIGVTVNSQEWQNVIGDWGNNSTQPYLNFVSGTTYSLTLSPNLYSYFGVNTSDEINGINVVFRSADGNQQTEPDYFIPVGAFQLMSSYPQDGQTVTINQGQNLNITATASQSADWTLKANGNTVHSASNITNYSYGYPINQTVEFELTASRNGQILTVNFTAIVTPNVATQPIPEWAEQGINYNQTQSKATLALYAPHKNYIHVIGSFNNWAISNDYLMKRDTVNPDLYWLEINGLNPGEVYTFQYRTDDGIKTADPYSTLVLSPYDDPWISSSTYPNMPQYPAGQDYEVSVLQTGQTPYNWQINNFQKPDKENLVVYELLVRDFNSAKTWNSLIEDFDYFKNMNINAIEILPVMEFEGNISWGYNPAYHLALDKAYGPANTMKAFIDKCHQNGIAVILDVALNHVFGRSPLVRMWMDNPDGSFGNPTAQNPYCHTEAKHAYNVGYDLNHQSAATQYYVKRTIEHWINEFKIDGFRWDLTKGFTNNCSPTNEGCTNSYQADRVAILKQYADYQWALDPDFYVIFEHLGVGSSHTEEIEWSNYRVDEGKGILLWNKMTDPYNQNTMGYPENSNFNHIKYSDQGYSIPANVAYAESHDEERLMYKNLQYGNSSGSYDVKNLNTALKRQEAVGAVLFTIPGPKMFWQFGELGYDFSINHCEDGSVNDACRTDPKPIPFELGYQNNPNRMAVYNTWAQIIGLRLSNEVFSTTTYTVESGDLKPRIYIWDDNISSNELKNVVVFANFTTTSQNITPYFPYTGTWYNLMDSTTLNVTSTDQNFTVTLQPGEFRIFGNQIAQMEITDLNTQDFEIKLYPNPTKDVFHFSENIQNMEIFDLNGKLLKTVKNLNQGKSFDISGLSKGVYIITGTVQGKKFTKKLVKQ